MQIHASSSLSSSSVRAAAASAPAGPASEPPAADPLDELIRSSKAQAPAPAPSSGPWTELENLGLLGASAAISGPVGAALTETARTGLKDALDRIQAGGVKLERTRRFRLPWVMDKHVPVSSDEMLDRVAGSKGELKRLRALLPGQKNPAEIRGLADLRALDGLHGVGVSALADGGAPRMEALEALVGKDATFRKDQYSYYEEDQLTSVGAYREMEDGKAPWVSLKNETYQLKGEEALFSLDYFQGSGEDRGLKDPGRASRIRAATERGLRFSLDERNATPRQLYLSAGGRLALQRDGSRVALPIEERDLLDLDGLDGRLAAFEKDFHKLVTPALRRAGAEDWTSTVSKELYREDPRFSREQRCALFGEFLSITGSTRDRRDAVEEALTAYRGLLQERGSAFEVARKARMILPTLRTSSAKTALAVLAKTREGVASRAFRSEAQAKVEETFFRLLEATGSVDTAFEAVDLVRIPVGNERPEERLGLFLALAAREGDSTLRDSAEHYRSLLANRAPSEGLVRTGERFLRLLEGLGVGRHQADAPRVFTALQEDLAAGRIDSSAADDRLDLFLRNMVLSNDVDKALEASFGSPDRPPGEIEEEGEYVEIGGIRIPRREQA